MSSESGSPTCILPIFSVPKQAIAEQKGEVDHMFKAFLRIELVFQRDPLTLELQAYMYKHV
jgi:hypothetical protein